MCVHESMYMCVYVSVPNSNEYGLILCTLTFKQKSFHNP